MPRDSARSSVRLSSWASAANTRTGWLNIGVYFVPSASWYASPTDSGAVLATPLLKNAVRLSFCQTGRSSRTTITILVSGCVLITYNRRTITGDLGTTPNQVRQIGSGGGCGRTRFGADGGAAGRRTAQQSGRGRAPRGSTVNRAGADPGVAGSWRDHWLPRGRRPGRARPSGPGDDLRAAAAAVACDHARVPRLRGRATRDAQRLHHHRVRGHVGARRGANPAGAAGLRTRLAHQTTRGRGRAQRRGVRARPQPRGPARIGGR